VFLAGTTGSTARNSKLVGSFIRKAAKKEKNQTQNGEGLVFTGAGTFWMKTDPTRHQSAR